MNHLKRRLRSSRGFTLLEVMICLAIGGIVLTIVTGAYQRYQATGTLDFATSSASFGINGLTETRCIDGFKFTVGEGGHARQILNAQGGGIACN